MNTKQKIKIIRKEQQRINDLLKAQCDRIDDLLKDENYHPSNHQKLLNFTMSNSIDIAYTNADACIGAINSLKKSIQNEEGGEE